MPDFTTSREELLSLFPRMLDIAHEQGSAESVERLQGARQRLADGRLTTVICGEFKRGKSSLLGALVEDPGLFPVDVDIATNMVTTISYGPAEEITVSLAGDDSPITRPISRTEVPEYATEAANPRNMKNAVALSIRTPNEKLESGLTLVDTPGVGALNAAHTAVTYGFLPTADAVIFVGDATAPLTETELDFVRRIDEYCKVVMFVVTKIDLRDDYQAIVDNTTAKLAEVTGRACEDITVVPVSSRAKLAYLDTKDDEDLELSNFPEFERLLNEVLERGRGRILLNRAVADLERTAEALLLPLRTELRATEQAGEHELAEVERKLQTEQQRLNELKEGSAEWRRELSKLLGDVYDESLADLTEGLIRVWRQLDAEYLEDERMQDDPGLIVDALQADVAMLLGSLARSASQRAAEVQEELERKTGLALSRRGLGELALPPIEFDVRAMTQPIETQEERRNRKLRDATFSGGITSTIGSVLGAVLGGPMAFITAPVGAAIGGLIGGGVGYRNAIKGIRLRDRIARRAAISRELQDLKTLQHQNAQRAVKLACRELHEAVQADLEAKIQLAQQSSAAALRSLREVQSHTAKRSAPHLQELSGRIRTLEGVGERCRAIMVAAEREPAAGRPEKQADTAPADAGYLAALSDDPGNWAPGRDR